MPHTALTDSAGHEHEPAPTRAPRGRQLQLACVLSVLYALLSAGALAQQATARGEVIVILAKDADGPIDPSLSSLRALKEPPFNGYGAMSILSREKLELPLEAATEVDLPNGRKLRITLLEQRKDGRAKLQVSINRPNKKDYLPLLEVLASPGEPFFVAGQKYQGGTLVIGVRIGERAARK